MAEISTITSGGVKYDLCDKKARAEIEELKNTGTSNSKKIVFEGNVDQYNNSIASVDVAKVFGNKNFKVKAEVCPAVNSVHVYIEQGVEEGSEHPSHSSWDVTEYVCDPSAGENQVSSIFFSVFKSQQTYKEIGVYDGNYTYATPEIMVRCSDNSDSGLTAHVRLEFEEI